MKQKQVLFILVGAIVLMLGGQLSTPLQRTSLQEQIAEKQRRGYSVKFLDNTLVELTEPMTGAKHLKSLLEPSEAEIRAWAARRGVPIMEIDPNTIDTSRYAGLYRHWSTVPASNSGGWPLQIDDLNSNRRTEVYGIYWNMNVFRSPIYEVDSSGSVTLAHEFVPRVGGAMQFTDIDHDSLQEVYFQFGDSAYFFEQAALNTLPTRREWVYAKDEYPGTAIKTREFIGDLDGDASADYLYRGSVPDSVRQRVLKTHVAEFDRGTNGFRKVWSSTLFGDRDSFLGNYEVGDFDGDGRKDFLSSTLQGYIAVAENDGDNSFSVVWRDTVAFSNLYYLGSGDIDRDGKAEFFVTATASGDWINVFESAGDNRYSQRLLIHLRSGGTFDEPQFLTRDVNADGAVELVVRAGSDIYMLNSLEDDTYYVSYLKRNAGAESIQFHDFNFDGKLDFIIGTSEYVYPPGYYRNRAEVHVASEPASLEEESSSQLPSAAGLFVAYPNPFNQSVTLQFTLSARSSARLSIFDILGKEVAVLLLGILEAGTHSVTWESTGKSSGVYLCRLEADKFTISRKLVLTQ